MHASGPISIPACDRPSAGRIFWTSVSQDETLAASPFACLIGVVLLAISGLTIWQEARFQIDGVTVRGRVTGKQITSAARPGPVVASLLAHGGGRKPHHVIDCEYVDTTGVTQVARASLSANRWNRINIGDPIDVTYLRGDPAVCRVAGQNRPPLLLMAGFVVAGSLALYGSLRMFIAGAGRVRRNLELFQTGEPVLSRVVEIVVSKGRKGREYRSLHYSYPAPETLSGRPVPFTGTCPGTGKRGKSAERGDLLLVCYDERDPQRHAVDRYGLFQLDRLS